MKNIEVKEFTYIIYYINQKIKIDILYIILKKHKMMYTSIVKGNFFYKNKNEIKFHNTKLF